MPHLLHEMKSTRVPRRYVFIDTEAHRARANGVETQTWRCGVTAEVHWQSKEARWSKPNWRDHVTAGSLWGEIASHARQDTRTVVVAHNFSYDLRISDGLRLLGAMGFELDKITLSHGHVGFDAVRGHERLVLVDSLTVLPHSIEALGKILGLPKPNLPHEQASEEAWLARCRADVAILMAAYLVVIDRLRTHDLGCWARTGSGIAWNTLLRRHLAHKVLVHENDPIRTIEAEASYGGRAEAWQWGHLRKDQFTEWDFELAYANVLADEWLPAYLYDETGPVTTAHLRKSYPQWRHLCRAKVRTESPVLPWKDDKGVTYPIGDFEGVWWEIELLAAEREGASVEVISALRYKGQPWLQTWANWVIDAVADKSSPEAMIWGAACKHFQRALVGRSSMRYRGWNEVGPAYLQGVHYMPLADLDAGTFGACLQINGRRWEAWERTWWDSALPQLLSSVIAHCRVNLWTAMRTAGLENVIYVDTDALITNSEGSRNLAEAIANGKLGSLRRKSTMTRLDVWAPRYVVAPGYTRIAGVSRDRRQIGEHRFEGEAWERLPEALQLGNQSSVIVRPVTADLRVTDWHRVHLAGGQTAPYEVVDGGRVLAGGNEAVG